LSAARIAAGALAALLLMASPAAAGDPIMPLSEVKAGMQCTGYSVVKGTAVESFAVEVLDVVVGDPSTDGPRLLVRTSGPAVDDTGIGPGFSGSPVYCPGADGTPRNAGAISESIGEFGGRTVLATPIEAILGNPVEPPAGARSTSRLKARPRSLAAPLTVSGASAPVAQALASAGAKRGRIVLQAPAGPVGSFPVQPLVPGAAMGIGLSSGDLTIGAIGTVAYVDGDRVWSLGHPYDNVGRRSLLLQDAYVYRVINNPNQLGELGGTYKLAAAGHDVGVVTNDALTAVVGRLGALPRTIPVHVTVRDEDTKAERVTGVRVADEIDVGNPTGSSPLTFIAPVAVASAVSGLLKSAPVRLSGEMCLQIGLAELPGRPVRFCNRYISEGSVESGGGLVNVVASRAGTDAADALGLLDTFKVAGLHVTNVAARISVRRGQRQALLRSVRMPRRVRPGQRVRVRLDIQRVRGARETRTFRLRLPRSLRPGSHRLVFQGVDADTPDADLFGGLTLELGGGGGEESTEPRTLRELVRAIRKVQRWDGIKLLVDPDRADPLEELLGEDSGEPDGQRAYRDPELRISGRFTVRVQVARR